MTKQQLREAIRRIIKQELNETLNSTEAEEIAKQAGNYEQAVDDLEEKGLSHKEANMIATKIYGENEAKLYFENAPAPAETKPKPGVKDKPATPDKKEPRRRLEPKPVTIPAKAQTKQPATMKEAEMLKQVIKRFKSKKTNEGIDDISAGIKPYSKFSSTDQLLKSISDRLITASQMQDWNLVDEIAIDVYNFIKNK